MVFRRVAVMVSTLACAASAWSQDAANPLPPERYNIKQDEARVGSNIPRREIDGVAIPLNRNWAQLTPEQQVLWKRQYETMPTADEPPFPVDGLGVLNKSVTQGLRGHFESGKLDLNVRIDAEGNATAVSIFASPTPEIARTAASVLMVSKFKPAVCAGQPCTMDFPFKLALRKIL
jgi:hypothetical protein